MVRGPQASKIVTLVKLKTQGASLFSWQTQHFFTVLTAVSLLQDRDGGWSPWGFWSTCNRQCDAGLRWRRRQCDNPTPLGHGIDCPGHSMEGQECNAHSCKGKPMYSQTMKIPVYTKRSWTFYYKNELFPHTPSPTEVILASGEPILIRFSNLKIIF